MEEHLWLIGMMGSGKTATARALGKRWGVAAIDTDAQVMERTGCSIAQLWGERGEAAFRAMESAALLRLAAGDPAVISTGGGVVLDPSNTEAMQGSGRIVWLSVSPGVLSRRVGDGSGRPLLDRDASEAALRGILEQRSAVYASAADLTIDATELTVDETADRIEAWWNPS